MSLSESPTGKTAPAVARNREPILEVLRPRLAEGFVLEVASGTGEHAVWLAENLPGVTWQPTDRDGASLDSITAWRTTSGLTNLLAPLMLDATEPENWPVSRADAVVAINMIHISPWPATIGLMVGASTLLPIGGILFLYGPFREANVPIAPSNAAFDADLRSRNPAWGLRDLGEVAAVAARHDLVLEERIGMPANNLSVIFRKR